MALPPGLTYLFSTLVHFGIPSVVTYVLWYFVQETRVLPINIPYWAIVTVAICTRPIIFLVSKYHSRWANKRAAAANSAIIAPYVKQSTYSIIAELIESNRDGYPGGHIGCTE
ncbi:hypothetical protein CVT25_001721 [Psilocybe cyanescens]|uniref:Uncharacterized protein n=1 Tax=Psilocybe cyanescens TaxID=93625 RepID=A0A409WPH5_PSICY|nr:hypothetical protein CVT25_001721 [Psilocybe cyanescens]